jgi:integrase
MASVRLKSGSQFWWACVTLPGGERRQFSTGKTDRNEALEIATRAERETHRQRSENKLRDAFSRLLSDVVGAAPVPPKQWLLQWLERRGTEVKDVTAESYRPAVNEAGDFFAERGRESLSDVTIQDVQDLRAKWTAANSATTANYKLKVLRGAFKDAWQARVVTENVVALVRSVKDKDSKKSKRRDFRADELPKLFKACDTTWRCLCTLGLLTGGQRFGDLATLRRRDVDLKRKEINTSAQKTGKPIILPIVAALEEALQTLPLPKEPDAFLFPEMAALKKASRSKRFHRLLYEAGLIEKRGRRKGRVENPNPSRRTTSELGFHSFRHTATTMLKAAGVSDSVAKAIVGHESAAVSKVYTHMPMDTMRAALEKLSIPK